ncbi:MAG: hypothetical protein JW940_10890 [Polyangiaceae bacterium]|nr:hypothetical protein [Polyangiaceae bacterium]
MIGDRQAVGLVALVVVGWVACGGKSSHGHRNDDAAGAGSPAAAGTYPTASDGRRAAGAGGEANASGGAGVGGEADLGGVPSAGGERNTGGSKGDDGSGRSGAGGADAGLPRPTTFVLRNDTDAPIYVQVEFRQWLSVTVDGENVVLASSCWCGEPSCPDYEPPLPAVAAIAPGESYTYDWDGHAAIWKDTCYERTLVRGDYAALFCYGTSASYSASDFGDVVDDPQCKTVAFELGDASVVLRVAPPHPTMH